MATRDYQSEVIDIVADERGLPRARVQLSLRLRQDLGMDGDDAVEFFKTLHERFGTDLTQLNEHWSDHFGPEGFSLWNGVVFIPAAIVGGLAAAAASLSAVWGVAIGVILVAAWVWTIRRWGPPDKMVPITVGEVIAAVEAGAWPRRSEG